ncbi:MAG: hypothetical protein Ct9H300mP19_05910 [Dehalococcoidia bacterium]|nr:MAG: hypothetical protein Ct9H300mP19_05910 [Dehalococcoidia bacterium]
MDRCCCFCIDYHGVSILINNPLGVAIFSPFILGGLVSAVCLFTFFVWWELNSGSPMLQLRMFKNLVMTMAVVTRFLGFLGTTTVRFLVPIYLISLRDIQEAAVGGILFLTSLGMAIAASTSGRLGDRLERDRLRCRFLIVVITALFFTFFNGDTSCGLSWSYF